jgi:hypothetical protein
MGAPTTPNQAGGTLPQQVQGAYGNALNQYGNVANAGNTIMQGSIPYAQQGAELFSEMGGMKPTDVTAGQLSNTDLSPYMNPYTQNVIDTSMKELNKQYGVQQQGVDDAAQRQNAFGSDRMYFQKGIMGREFLDTKSKMLADLYSKNFQNAQQMGQYDINNRLQSDQFNQGLRGQLYGQAGQGLSNIGLGGLQTGGQLASGGAGGMGDLASSGFQMANAANASQTAAAAAQQQQQQQAIDTANANYARLLGIPAEYLQAMQGIGSGLGNFGTTKTNQQQNPGALSTIGAGVGILGTIAGMGI